MDDQETLTDLLDHYKALGPDGFQEEIVWSRYRSPGTNILKSENVKHAAIELRGIGIETLQDVQSESADEIKCALRSLSGIGDRTIHMFLTYAVADEYEKSDIHVCRFVATALRRPRGWSEAPRGYSASRLDCWTTRSGSTDHSRMESDGAPVHRLAGSVFMR